MGKLDQGLDYIKKVVKIDPGNTSRTCNHCGTVDRRSRMTQAGFRRLSSGHIANADINAALNILERGTVHLNGEAASLDGRRNVNHVERKAA